MRGEEIPAAEAVAARVGAPVRRRALSGWGRYPRRECRVAAPDGEAALAALLRETDEPVIARGAGRAYGDSALGVGLTLSMRRFDRLLSFDPTTGDLTAEAGVALGEVIAAMLPKGWFPPVTPGTKFVTIGGVIAADVHGKNHHSAGCFGDHVRWIDLMGADGTVRRVSPDSDAELFRATIGGMGLTGIVLRACFRMLPVESAWIRQRTVASPDLDATMAAFEAGADHTYSVAWIDCLARGAALGRSLLFLGEHARRDELDPSRRAAPFAAPLRRKKAVPIDAPSWALNRLSVTAFNSLIYARGRRKVGEELVDWDQYFYPLDAVSDWNRIYGRQGFVQFQCVLPEAASRAGLEQLLREIGRSGSGSFLAVLKQFGAHDSAFSFPHAGWTLALDFPATRRALALVDRLDAITLAHGGRFYLAKDARMSRDSFDRSETRAAGFRALRAARGLDRFASAQSERLGL